MSERSFDLVVVGGGPAGYMASFRAAQLGMKVAVVEKERVLGGTCLRVGCIPSKALLESSEHFEFAREKASRHGVKIEGVSLDLPAMMGRKEKVVGTLAKGLDFLCKKNKVERIVGSGRIAGPGRVVVEGAGGAGEKAGEPVELVAKHVLIATGSKVASLPGVEVDGDRVGTSTEALAWGEVPESLVVIGAGAIGLELGSVWRRLGSKVTVLEYLDRILPGMDSEIAAEALKILKRQGMEFRLGARVTSAKAAPADGPSTKKAGAKARALVTVEGAEPIEADRVLMAVGRVPFTEGLGLEAVGIRTGPRGRIEVDENFQTSVPGIYAVGDAIRGPMLAHKAEEEGIACVETLAGGHGHVNYDAIPAVVYTHPEVASVGRTEEELKEAGVAYRKGVFPFTANGRALSIDQAEGRVKMLADAKTDRILGVHIVGPHAGDLIAEAAVAIEFKASSEDLARSVHAHPTLAEAVKEAALAVDGRSLSM